MWNKTSEHGGGGEGGRDSPRIREILLGKPKRVFSCHMMFLYLQPRNPKAGQERQGKPQRGHKHRQKT